MKRPLRILATLLLLAVPALSNAQTARLYTSEEGLPSSQINDIYQDSKGFIWISTENGLALFDGMEIHSIQSLRDSEGTLASNLVLTTFEDRSGTFWVGTSKGLQTYDIESGRFTTVDLGDIDVPGSTQHISSIVEVSKADGSSEIWVGTSQHGIYIIDEQTHKPDAARQNAINELLPSLFVNRLFADSRGRMWIASETGGLSVISLKDRRNLIDGMWTDETRSISSTILVTDFAEDSESGDIIISSSNCGLLVAANSELRRPSDNAARNCSAMALLRDRMFGRAGDRAFLVGLEDGGYKLYDLDTDRLQDVYSGNILFDTSGWKIHSLMEDNQGNVWMGAFLTGVMVVPRSMYGFEYFNLNALKEPDSKSFGCVTSIYKDERDNTLWVGTDGSGLVKITATGACTIYNSENSGLGSDAVMALEKDGNGILWIATYQGGLYKYSNGRIRAFRDNSGLGSAKTVDLAYDRSRNLLFAGTHGAGLSIIDLATDTVIKTISEDPNKWVSALYVDRSGMLWVGTFNGPLCYNHATGKMVRYDVGDHSMNSRVYNFFESRDGKMWIGTGEGLLSYDKANAGTVRYSEEDGLSSNVVCGILESEDGNIWVSTFRGLNRLTPSTGRFTRYYAYDGLQDNEFHYRAAFRCADGQMIFGGISGLSLFYPQMIDQKIHDVPPVYFTALNVNNREIDYTSSEDRGILDKHILEATSITLPHSRNNFSVEYAVLEYTNPQKMVYSHKLERFDRTWQSNSPYLRAVTYTNLPAGRYTLKVRASFENDDTHFSERAIRIRIRSPWYSSVWAYILYILAFCGVIMLIRRNILKEKAHEDERRESEVKEMKLEMFSGISQEIRTPMTLVMSPLKELREAETDSRRKDLYNLMYRNCHRVLRLVNQLMDIRKLDSGELQFHFRETDIVFFVKDIVHSFETLAQSRGIGLEMHSEEDEEMMWIDQGHFDKVIFNLLSNSFRYTPEGGSIRVNISGPAANDGVLQGRIASYLQIDIANSGEAGADIDLINEKFSTSDVLNSKTNSDAGLYLAKKLVERHHGTLSVLETEDGVCFSIIVPCGNEHLSAEEMTPTELHKDLYTRYSADSIIPGDNSSQSEPQKESKSKKDIVIVDADSEMRSYLRMELGKIYNVKSCANGKSAWGIISTTIPDAVITDLSIEGMDGFELCTRIKRNPGTNHIPVIIMSTSTDEASEQKSSESGADTFLTKPLSIELLKSSLSNAIATRDTLRGKFTTDIQYNYDDMKMNVRSGSQVMDTVMDVIRKNLDNPDFSVETLSKEVGMSRVHLNRKLKESMNISPSDLIRSMRLKQAAWLLIHNEANVSEVSYRIGFSSPSYFSNAFHKYFGMSPKEFLVKYRDCEDEETLNRIFGNTAEMHPDEA